MATKSCGALRGLHLEVFEAIEDFVDTTLLRTGDVGRKFSDLFGVGFEISLRHRVVVMNDEDEGRTLEGLGFLVLELADGIAMWVAGVVENLSVAMADQADIGAAVPNHGEGRGDDIDAGGGDAVLHADVDQPLLAECGHDGGTMVLQIGEGAGDHDALVEAWGGWWHVGCPSCWMGSVTLGCCGCRG